MSNDFLKKVLLILLLLFFCQFFCFSMVLAAEDTGVKFKPQVGIPGTEFQKGAEIPIPQTTAKIAEYIKGFYIFLISALAILSVVMIAWAGITWLTAGGSAEKVGTAKARILGALGGLALGLVSYVILQTINPALVDFKLSTIAPVDPLYMQNVVAKDPCPINLKDVSGKPIPCGQKYAPNYNVITEKKEEEKIEGCMGFYCEQIPFSGQVPLDLVQKGVCQYYVDDNGNYTGGGCYSNTFITVKDASGQVLYRSWGPSNVPLAAFDKSRDCGQVQFKTDISLMQLLGLADPTGYSLWIGTKCDNSGQTCAIKGDAVYLNHTFGQSGWSDFFANLKAFLGSGGMVNNMECKP